MKPTMSQFSEKTDYDAALVAWGEFTESQNEELWDALQTLLFMVEQGNVIPEALEKARNALHKPVFDLCQMCGGTGKIDDAGCGDIAYNECECPECKK